MYVEIDLSAGSGAIELREPDDFRSLKVVVHDESEPGIGLEGVLAPVGRLGWGATRSCAIDALKDLARERARSAEWIESFDAMVEYARSRGWLADDGSALQAHCERCDPWPGKPDRGEARYARTRATRVPGCHRPFRHGRDGDHGAPCQHVPRDDRQRGQFVVTGASDAADLHEPGSLRRGRRCRAACASRSTSSPRIRPTRQCSSARRDATNSTVCRSGPGSGRPAPQPRPGHPGMPCGRAGHGDRHGLPGRGRSRRGPRRLPSAYFRRFGRLDLSDRDGISPTLDVLLAALRTCCAIELGAVSATVGMVPPDRLAELRRRMLRTRPVSGEHEPFDLSLHIGRYVAFHECVVGLVDSPTLLDAYRQAGAPRLITRLIGARAADDVLSGDGQRVPRPRPPGAGVRASRRRGRQRNHPPSHRASHHLHATSRGI